MAPSLPAWRPRKTLIDLYNEKDQTPWYMRTLATLSAMLLLIGFLIFPSAFHDSSASPNTHPTNVALIAALILVILSYVGSGLLAFLTISWLFHLDIIFIPNFTSSVLGLVNIAYSLAVHPSIELQGRAVLALVLAIVSLLGHAIMALLVFRKIHIVREKEATHRHTSPGPNIFTLPETEMQRQQLLRLLTSPKDSKVDSPLETESQATYKIQWPGGSNAMQASRRNTPHTLRGLSFSRAHRHSSAIYASSPGETSHHQPHDNFTAGVERMPDVILEESTISSVPSHPDPHHPSPPSALRPVVYNPLLPAFFEHHPGERVPSYHPRPATYIYAPTPRSAHPSSRPPPLGHNGYPSEKPEEEKCEPFESIKGPRPPLQGYAVVDADREARARTAGAPGRPSGRRAEIELAGRGNEGTRVRAEMGVCTHDWER